MDSTTSNTTSQATVQATMSGGKTVTNTNCPKMGSRRIFTPQFKLQVLESYRSDHDCKGNQRATARKYNIHRRQIQKWLQCEASLRSSVVNINQNAIKHQFHNVNMQQQQHQQQTKNVATTQTVANGLSCSTNHLQSAHLCLDLPKGSASHKTIEVPSLSSSISISSTQETRDILTSVSDISSATAIVSPLRPAAVMSATKNSNASMSPLLHHQHQHHHHYGIQSFSNMSSPSTVPLLVHHLNNAQQLYQYENIHYAPPPTLSHHQTEKDHATYLPPPMVLPTTAANNNYTIANSERFDKFDMLLMGAKTYSKTLSDKSFLYNSNQYHTNHECSNVSRFENTSNTAESFSINQFTGDASFSSGFSFGPMDLSLRHNKNAKTEITGGHMTTSGYQITETPIKKQAINNVAEVVDLTCRKRRVSNTNNSSNDYNNEYPEKQQKLSINTEVKAYTRKAETIPKTEHFSNHANSSANCNNEDDDIEIEVGTEEKFPPASKPVKLFKPYLLDEYENNDFNSHLINSNNNKSIKNKTNEEQILKTADTAANDNNTFPDAVKENINICVDSTNFFVESRSESPRSACSPATYVSTLSPTNFQYSKGSPASSGYESSTSTYSDTSLSSKNDTSYTCGQTYSVNLQMQTIYQENIHHVIHPSQHVQRWLEKDDSNSPETNSTIALFV